MTIALGWGIGLGFVAGGLLAVAAMLAEWLLGVVRPHYEGYVEPTLAELLRGALPMPGLTASQLSHSLRFVRQPFLHLLGVLIEEGIFRWLLIGGLGRLIGFPAAMLISGISFGLIHWPQVRPMRPLFLVNAFLISLLLGLLYLHSSVWAAVALHLGFNIAQWQICGYPVYGRKVPSLLRVEFCGQRRPTGLEDSPQMAVCLSLMVAGLFYWIGPVV